MSSEDDASLDGAFDGDRTLLRTVTLARRPRAGEPGWVHTLVVVQGEEPGRRVLVESTPVSFGRREGSTVVLNDAQVSGRHCVVERAPGTDALRVTDLGSTNGTFVAKRRVQPAAMLPPGALIQIGQHLLRHEFTPPQAASAALELDRDLDRASGYVQSLLPPPIDSPELQIDWLLKPCARLGGDAFGYRALDDEHFVGYLIDVSGHGAGAAMHSVSVMNMLRHGALAQTDLREPAQVLRALNEAFQMDSHAGLYFTLWYGVHHRGRRQLAYASAGHHPSYLRSPGTDVLVPLQTRNPFIGMLPGIEFAADVVDVPPGSRLYAFSDGMFEITSHDGSPHGLQEFLPLITEAPTDATGEPDRLFRRVCERSRPGPLDDDCSILTVTFLS